MFYCNECADKHDFFKSLGQSLGECEICGKVASCNDVPSSRLPKVERPFQKTAHIGISCTVRLDDTEVIIVNKSGFKHAPYLVTLADAFEHTSAVLHNAESLQKSFDLSDSMMRKLNVLILED